MPGISVSRPPWEMTSLMKSVSFDGSISVIASDSAGMMPVASSEITASRDVASCPGAMSPPSPEIAPKMSPSAASLPRTLSRAPKTDSSMSALSSGPRMSMNIDGSSAPVGSCVWTKPVPPAGPE